MPRLSEEDIGAIPAGRFKRAVVQDDRVEIRIARRIATGADIGLPNAAATVDEHLIKAAPVGAIFRFVTQMPLAVIGQ